MRGNPLWPVNSSHKGQWRGALMSSLIFAWTNGWVNTRDAGDLRRHHAHYDVTLMVVLNHPGNRGLVVFLPGSWWNFLGTSLKLFPSIFTWLTFVSGIVFGRHVGDLGSRSYAATTMPTALLLYPDSNVGWANIGPTSVRQYRRWVNVGPIIITVWVAWHESYLQGWSNVHFIDSFPVK